MAKLDLKDPAFRADPYPTYARLRQESPVYMDDYGFWYVFRHADVQALIRDTRLGKDLRRWMGYAMLRPYGAGSTFERYVEQWMLSREPPDHTRLRKLAMLAFTPRATAHMRATVERTADEVLASLPLHGEIELMTAFAQQFPLYVISGILDLPRVDYPRLKLWSEDVALVVEPTIGKKLRQRADQATVEMVAYLKERIAERRERRGEDLLSNLIAAEEAGDRLSEDELVAMLLLLFVAGHETTTNLIGNGILGLWRHPGELERLRADRSLMPKAIEELLRWDAPGMMSGRATHEPIEVGGKQIPAQQLIMLMLGSGNRDPEVFRDPDRVDLSRDPNPHLAFGGGIHYCLGAPLARMEAEIAFNRMLDRWPSFTVDESGVARRDLSNLRALARLPLKV